jgi:GTPase SAR1 family protein
MFVDTFSHTLDATDRNDNVIASSNSSSNNNNNIIDDCASKSVPDNEAKSFLAAAYGRQLHLSIWDLSGNPRYSTAMLHFIEPQALMLVVFSLAEYSSSSSEQQFDRLIGSWFDLVLGKSNRLVCIVVGTHADMVDRDTVEKLKRNVVDSVNRSDVYNITPTVQ